MHLIFNGNKWKDVSWETLDLPSECHGNAIKDRTEM